MDEDINISFGNLPNFASISYNILDILKQIKHNIDHREYDFVKNIICKQHEIIFTYNNLVNENRPIIQSLFAESREFITIIHSIIGIIDLNKEEVIFLNKMIYDYFEFYNGNNLDYDIKNQLLAISYIINKKSITALSSKMPLNQARILSIIMKSSFKIEKVVHRVNNFFIDGIDMSLDDMVETYQLIYPKELYPEFICYTMFEYSPGSGEIKNKFNRISNVVLNIISNEEIINFELFKNIFINYGNMIKMLGVTEDKVRFKFKEVIEKDPHNIVLGYIKAVEYAYDVYIP